MGKLKKLFNTAVDFFTGSNKDVLKKYFDQYTQEFVPEFFKTVVGENDSVNVSEAVDHLDMLRYGLRKMYFEDFTCWRDEMSFKTHVCTNDLLTFSLSTTYLNCLNQT